MPNKKLFQVIYMELVMEVMEISFLWYAGKVVDKEVDGLTSAEGKKSV